MLLIFSSVSFAESSVDLPEFNLEVERIEKLIDSNAGLALQQLMRYQHRLSQLSVKQRINYHSLLKCSYCFGSFLCFFQSFGCFDIEYRFLRCDFIDMFS